MTTTTCPECGNSYLAYCYECGQSVPFNTGIPTCTHVPEHIENKERWLHCSSCGYQVPHDKEAGHLVWLHLKEVNFDEKGYTRSRFLHFEEGTDRYTIKKWWSKTFDITFEDLYKLE
jgi:hypothetical protein